MKRIYRLFIICLCQFVFFAQAGWADDGPETNNDAPSIYSLDGATAKVVWPLSDIDNISSYSATPNGAFSSISVNTSQFTLTMSSTGQATYPNGDLVTFARLKPLDISSTVEWTVKPTKGLTFIPTRISAYIARFGTDKENGVTISARTADGETLELGNFTAPRNNKAQEEDKFGYNDNYTNHFVIELTEEQQLLLTTTDSLSIFGTTGVGTNKEGGFADLTIEGTLKSPLPPLQSVTLEEGRYYLKNAASQKWLGAGNRWGTQASLLPHAEFVTLHPQENYYLIETQVNNGGTSYWFNGSYMDSWDAIPVFIETDESGYYYLSDGNAQFYGYNGSTVLSNCAEISNAKWQIFTEEEMQAMFAEAAPKNPIDATWMIMAPNFSRNNRNIGFWEIDDVCWNSNLSGGESDDGSVGNNCAESWHSTFTICQTLNGVPNGTYTLKAQGFYRQDGSDDEHIPLFFANSEMRFFPLKEGTENSMTEASRSFSDGGYCIEPLNVFVEDNTITIGVRNESNDSLWCIWDNFELTYYGTEQVYIDSYDELVATATELLGEQLSERVLAGLTTALAMPVDNSTERSAAIAALTEAVDKAQAYLVAGSKLMAMKTLTETTNFYTEEAYNNYYQQWVDKFEAGTLTRKEAMLLQNPYDVTGWHQNVLVDNFLLSVWDAPAENYESYYINTWSTEGEYDGTGFVVPFFEYWVGNYDTLENNTLTATISGLEKGAYDVTLEARVRRTNYYDDEPYGITMQVNGDDAVSLTSGENLADRFFIGTFTASGYVNDSGILTLTINVSDNNISWLSFRNVKYIRTGNDDPRAIDADDWAILRDAYPTMNGSEWYTPWFFGEEAISSRELPGVTVKDGKVTSIILEDNNVGGTFPTALLALENLQVLNLAGNNLSGDLSGLDDFVVNSPLRELNITNNQFTGNIGAFAAKLTLLESLWAANNQLETVSPMISPNVTDIEISNQNLWAKEYNLTPGDFIVGTAMNKLPNILTYDHYGQTFSAPSYCQFDTNDWNCYWYYEDGIVYSDKVYYGANGNIVQLYLPTINGDYYLQTTLTFDMGDANFDNTIDVLDLQADVNYLFQDFPENQMLFNFTAANLWDNDDEINLQDIIKEVNLLLSQTEEQPAGARRNASYDTAAEAIVTANARGELVLNTTQAVAALDLTVDGAQAFELASQLRQQGFACATRQQADGLHIVAYSLNGALMPIGETVLGFFTTQVAPAIVRATLADKGARRISVAVGSETTGIDEIANSKSSNSKWYDLQGRKVSNMSERKAGKGVYVTNGKKIVR